MASIRENKKNGKVVSYSFTAYVGQDDSGEYLRKYKTWKVPDGVPPSRAKKMAEREAEKWEKSLKKELPLLPSQEPPNKMEEATTNFNTFIDEVWFPIQVRGNNRKPKTIAFYESSTKLVNLR